MVRTPRHGLTWIEVLVIIAIIGVVISLILPATRRIREPAERMSCSNNLKYLMMALHSFDSMGSSAQMASASEPDAHADQVFPPGCLGPGTTPEERLSWMVALLPYVEEGSLHQRFDLHKGYAGNRAAAQMGIRVFLCPAAKDVVFTDAVTTYVAMAGIGHDAATQPAGAAGNGFMGYDRRTSLKMITDGTSNTIGLMETRFELGPWARGGSSTLRGFEPAGASLQGDNPPFGGHANGMNAAMADGSVRFLSPSIDPKILAAAITIAGGESLDPNWDSP